MAQLLGRRAVQHPVAVVAAADRARRASARPARVVTDGRWAPTRSASRWWPSGSGTTMPSACTRPQRSARCQSVSSSRSSTRWWWAIASATARWCARRVPRLNSSTPSCGHGHDAHHEPVVEHGQARRLEHHPADLGLHVRALLVPRPRPHHVAGPISSTQRRPSTSTSRLSRPSTIRKPRWWASALERRRGVPLARREPQHARERARAARARARSASSSSARSGSASTSEMALSSTSCAYPRRHVRAHTSARRLPNW